MNPEELERHKGYCPKTGEDFGNCPDEHSSWDMVILAFIVMSFTLAVVYLYEFFVGGLC